jgi:hypothetical protein
LVFIIRIFEAPAIDPVMSEAAEPVTKRVKREQTSAAKPEAASSSTSAAELVTSAELTEPQTNDQKEEFFDLSKAKRFTVRKWKGNILLDIREFYEKDGEMKPGKKGISLTLDQYKALRDLVTSGSIDAIVKKQGGDLE